MKLLVYSLLSSSLLVGSLAEDCIVGSVDPSVDYFPDKVTPTKSKLWSVTYGNTYKILKNLQTNSSYLLYQCGSEPPTSQQGEYDAIISIPLDKVAVEMVVSLPHLQELGKLDDIAVFTGDTNFISSPCFRQRLEAGEVAVVTPGDAALDSTVATTVNASQILATKVTFASDMSEEDPLVKIPVKLSDWQETTNEAIYEWIKYYSVFFNLEKIANLLFENSEQLYQCVAENAALVGSDKTDKPLVLWADYTSYCGGWQVGKCPSYYCEYAASCSVDILDSTGENLSVEACGGYKFMSTEDLVRFGKNADIWFYSGTNWDDTYKEFGSQLDQMKSVQNKKVLDYQGAGENAWWEERFSAYYDVLRDFCDDVGTTNTVGQNWFRNVFTDTVGSPGQCTASGDSLLIHNFECGSKSSNTASAPSTEAAPSTGTTIQASSGSLFNTVLALVSASLIVVLV